MNKLAKLKAAAIECDKGNPDALAGYGETILKLLAVVEAAQDLHPDYMSLRLFNALQEIEHD